MDTRKYRLHALVQITPRCNPNPPEIIVSFDHKKIYEGTLLDTTVFVIDQELVSRDYQLSVELINKTDADTNIATNTDKAVIIDRIIFNDIQSPKFVWAGEYRPIYPEPWATEQKAQGIMLDSMLKNHNYLGWNGKWTLTFSVPIFTWIHQVENLGWLFYD